MKFEWKNVLIVYWPVYFREDDNDKSDSDDEPVSFSLNNREKELRNMQNTILAAQEGNCQENGRRCWSKFQIASLKANQEICLTFAESDNDQEKEWEEQQIRKGTSMPQVRIYISQRYIQNASLWYSREITCMLVLL